jgi:hypothetical protein
MITMLQNRPSQNNGTTAVNPSTLPRPIVHTTHAFTNSDGASLTLLSRTFRRASVLSISATLKLHHSTASVDLWSSTLLQSSNPPPSRYTQLRVRDADAESPNSRRTSALVLVLRLLLSSPSIPRPQRRQRR